MVWHMSHRTLTALLSLLITAAAFGQETQKQYLSGKGIDDAVPWDFMVSAGNKSGTWTTIPVPQCWDVEGFGKLTFGRGEEPSTESGQYKHTFRVPADWSGQTVYLCFEGAMTDTEAKVNGALAGEKHQGAYYAFKYDVTKLIKFDGENLLEVTVDKESSNQSVNRAERRADYWNFGGIFRPVYLMAVPNHHIDRVAINAQADGSFAMDVFTAGQPSGNMIEAQVMDLQGNAVGPSFNRQLGEESTHLEARLDSPKQWTAETPNLYQVEVRLLQNNTVIHRTKQRFGFRTIEARPGAGLFVNGKRVILTGTNRHSFWPESGRATSERLSRMDVMVMKEMNCNAVRMSHYPPEDHFLDVCDELGLYVLDELGGWHQSYDTPTGQRLIGEMIRHDVNHPSILFWDNGNEGGWNRANDDEFARWDPQKRNVLHPWELFRGINTKHYSSYDEMRRLAAGPDIYMPTELLHGLFDGGLGAGLEEYWEVMHASPVVGGAFLWAYADETVHRKDNGKMDTAGNQAPDGIVGPHREREGSFYTAKRVWAPIIVTRGDGGISIENRYSFTNASQCAFTWQLRKFRSPSDSQAGFETVSEWKGESPSIAPGEKGVIKMEMPAGADRADALAVRVDDPTGRELWTYVFPLKDFNQMGPPMPAGVAGAAVSASENDDALTITAGDVAIAFDKKTGYVSSIQRQGKPLSLTNGPRLASGDATLSTIEHRADGPDQVVQLSYSGDLKSVTWRIKPGGVAQIDYAYSLNGPHDFFGISFDYPEQNVQSMKWLGVGPYHVWRNRTSGGELNVWENAYNNTMTGYSEKLVYPEFKGYYAGVRWIQLQTTEGPLLMAVDSPDKFVQVLKVQFPGDPKPGQSANSALSGNAWARFPDAGLSVLDAISPIGSKFRTPESTGPMGQKPVAKGEYRGTVRLFLGK
jgi:hypothetical protein